MNTSSRLPNILLITCHDLGRFLGCYGVPTVRTPHLDRLAADGVMFTSAFCTAPQCSPSRASLFTGRYPHSNGVMGLTHGPFAWDLHPEEEHLAQLLRRVGYRATLIGLLHESQDAGRCGFEDILSGGSGDEVSRRVLDRLAQYARLDQPFYLQVGYHEPHRVQGPIGEALHFMGFVGDYIEPDDMLGVTVPGYIVDEPDARREMAELQGAVRYLDTAVGRVLDGLHELGLEEQTLVIFTTDHGLALPRAKCSLYDPGLEIALILRLPSRNWTGGKQRPRLVSNVDIFPTIADLVGAPIRNEVQGKSLVPAIESEPETHHEVIFGEMTYHDYYHPQRCVRTERHKLIVNFSTAPSFMDPTQSWQRRTRTVVPPVPAVTYTPVVELYDLEADPLEWNNFADDAAYEDVRMDLLARLSEWMRSTADPLLQGAATSPRHHEAINVLTVS